MITTVDLQLMWPSIGNFGIWGDSGRPTAAGGPVRRGDGAYGPRGQGYEVLGRFPGVCDAF